MNLKVVERNLFLFQFRSRQLNQHCWFELRFIKYRAESSRFLSTKCAVISSGRTDRVRTTRPGRNLEFTLLEDSQISKISDEVYEKLFDLDRIK